MSMSLDSFFAYCACGLHLGLTPAECSGLIDGTLKWKTKFENKKLLQELGMATHSDIPDFREKESL